MKNFISFCLLITLSFLFLQNASSDYSPTAKEVYAANFLTDKGIINNPFLDLYGYTPQSAADEIKKGLEEGYQIYGENIERAVNSYRLGDTITRQEVIKIIAKLSSKTIADTCRGDFSDVDKLGWGCKYIEWALDKGYIAKNATFRPNANITKTEAMKLVLKVKGVQKIQTTDNWQNDYMETAYFYGIIEEKYSDYDAFATRGWIFQIATATIEKETEIQEKGGIISDEAM